MSVEESNQYDSNDDEGIKKKKKKNNKKKNNHSSDENSNNSNSNEEESKESEEDDEEDEDEEEEEEESGEDDDSYPKKKKKEKKKKKKKKKKHKKEEKDKTEEKESEEKIEIIEQKTRDDYLAQIEQLENELILEKKISESLEDDNQNSKEILRLQNHLIEKDDKLNQLMMTNQRQEEALSVLKRQLDKVQNKNKNKNRILLTTNFSNPNIFNGHNKKIFQNKRLILGQRKNSDESKNEAINIIMKIKEKAINVAVNRMNVIKKENEILKKELYKNDDYTNKLGLENFSNENKKKIEKSNFEIKILNNQLEEHKKCLNERELLNREYSELKLNLQEIKHKIKNVKNSIRAKEIDLNRINNSDTVDDSISNNNISHRSNVTKTITSPFQQRPSRNINQFNISKSYKNTILPIISPNSTKFEKNILSEDFYSKLKSHYNGRENEYEAILEKITETENSRNFIENKHKNEIRQFNTQILTLDEQFKILNNEGKGNGSNIRVLKYRLNTVRNEVKHLFNQIQKLKTKLDFTLKMSKERDYEIFLLKGQISSLKNLNKPEEKEIKNKLVEKPEGEKEKGTNTESDTNDNKNTNKKEKNSKNIKNNKSEKKSKNDDKSDKNDKKSNKNDKSEEKDEKNDKKKKDEEKNDKKSKDEDKKDKNSKSIKAEKSPSKKNESNNKIIRSQIKKGTINNSNNDIEKKEKNTISNNSNSNNGNNINTNSPKKEIANLKSKKNVIKKKK